LTLTDLGCQMRDYLWDEDSVPYGNQYLKEKLKTRYGDGMYRVAQKSHYQVSSLNRIKNRH